LAKKLGISQQMVSKYLKGKRKPKIETVYEIAKKLGTDYLWLYGVERTSIRVEPKDFGRRVRWIRAQNKIGKKEFAEKLGITIETLENMELRDKCPSADVLLDLTKLHPEKDFKWVSTGMSSEELEIDDLPQPIVSFSTAGRDPQGIDTSHYRAVPLLSDAVAAGEPAVNTDVVRSGRGSTRAR